jgi:hypothetical protein
MTVFVNPSGGNAGNLPRYTPAALHLPAIHGRTRPAKTVSLPPIPPTNTMGFLPDH